MVKFDRNYSLSIEKADGEMLIVKPPFTLEMDITRNALTSANICSLRIYNLSERNRSLIRKDRNNFDIYRKVELMAGYGTNLATIFSGNVTAAWSVREGTNFISQIESFDGGFAYVNGQVNTQFPAFTPTRSIISAITDSLPGVQKGLIGDFPESIQRGNAISGSATDALEQVTNGNFFIDNSVVQCLKPDECIGAEALVVNSQSGLLGTPIREEAILHFDMLFEPALFIGKRIILNSSTGQNFNGEYKCISIHHRGIISPVVSGTLITTVGLFFGTANLKSVTQ